MRALARLSRRPIVSGETRKEEAMRSAVSPNTVCSISGVRAAASIAGWPHTNISSSRLSAIVGNSSDSVGVSTRRLLVVCSRVFRARAPSRSRLRAVTISQASGLAGTPFVGQMSSA